jgi:hypothetical protein
VLKTTSREGSNDTVPSFIIEALFNLRALSIRVAAPASTAIDVSDRGDVELAERNGAEQ